MPRLALKEDTTALPGAFDASMKSYAQAKFQGVSISQAIQYYGGDRTAKQQLISDLAGTSDKSSKAYAHMKRNVNRWLKGTNPKQVMTDKIRRQLARKNPPASMNVVITGYIGYEGGDWRWRTIGNLTKINLSGSELQSFLDAMRAEDTHAAYEAIFAAYPGAEGLTVAEDASTQIHLTFS